MSQPTPEPVPASITVTTPEPPPVAANQHYIINVSYLEMVPNVKQPQNRVQQIVALTVDEAFTKFRAAQPTAEVTQVQRTSPVMV
jgi:hypothetical protein